MTKDHFLQPARTLGVVVTLITMASSGLVGQDFTPPETQAPEQGAVRLGLFGFSTRFGIDLEDNGEPFLSVALDVGSLASHQVRIRPSAEIGFANAVDTYVVNAELIYRLTPDTERAVPYVGVGVGVAGHDDCDPDPDCPGVWAQFAFGFELKLQESFSWLLEYHVEDAFSRHRLLVGLATRRLP